MFNRRFNTYLIVIAAIAFLVVFFAPKPKKDERATFGQPVVPIEHIYSNNVTIPVFSRGKVNPTREYKITSQVDGLVESISDRLIKGAAVKKDETLLKIDTQPLILDVATKRSDLDTAKLQLEETKAQAKVVRRNVGKNAPDFARYVPQIRKAESQVKAAEAALTYARQQLKNATVKAPTSGKLIDVFVQPGDLLRRATPIAIIYEDGQLEARLPFSDEQLNIAGLSSSDENSFEGIQVQLTEHNRSGPANDFNWKAKIVRLEGARSENQLLYAVARISNDNDLSSASKQLLPGSFVEAKVVGKEFNKVFSVPRDIIQPDDKIWVVDDQEQAQSLPITILYRGKSQVYFFADQFVNMRVITGNFSQLADGIEVEIKSDLDI